MPYPLKESERRGCVNRSTSHFLREDFYISAHSPGEQTRDTEGASRYLGLGVLASFISGVEAVYLALERT